VLFMCTLFILIRQMQYFSQLFFLPFVLMTSIVFVVVPHVCSVFSIWFEYPELLLLFCIAWMCSLSLVLNVCPICLMYLSGQSAFSCDISHSYCTGLFWILIGFMLHFVCKGIIFFCVLEQFCNFFTTFSWYVTVAHFVFCLFLG
jgi:hypothetical protein